MSVPRQDFPEAATQTFKAGAPVYLNLGYLNECGANPQLIMGIASRDGQSGSAAGAKTQTVVLAHPDTLFIGNLDASAALTGTGAATDRGKMYGITKHASNGKWSVDTDKAVAATSRVVVWDLYDQLISGSTGSGVEPAWTDTTPVVVFSFGNTFYQGYRTS